MNCVRQTFFEELLKEKTIVVPGIFFDINPAHRRNLFNSPCHHFVRLSFGPPLEDLDKGPLIDDFSHLGACSIVLNCRVLGLDAIERVLIKARDHGTKTFGHSYKKSITESLHIPTLV